MEAELNVMAAAVAEARLRGDSSALHTAAEDATAASPRPSPPGALATAAAASSSDLPGRM